MHMYHQHLMHSSINKKNKTKQRRFSLDLSPLSLLFPVETMALHRYIHDKRGQGKRKRKKEEEKNLPNTRSASIIFVRYHLLEIFLIRYHILEIFGWRAGVLPV